MSAPASDKTLPSEGAKPPKKKESTKKEPTRLRRWIKRLALGSLIGVPVTALVLWILIHRIEWLGPWLSDTGRSIVGNDVIASFQDWAYGVEDKYNLATKGDQAPTASWEVPSAAPVVIADPEKKLVYPAFSLSNVGPMHTSFSAPGDGEWVPVPDARNPDEPVPMLKTLLHPDRKRGWSQVVIVAVDLRQVRLHLVTGRYEPMTKIKEAREFKRRGTIADDHLAIALAAFNGGFKTTHGNYGVHAEGFLFVEPRMRACTVAAYANDVLKVGSWEELESSRADMQWFRQTPMCMFEAGKMHPGLTVEENTHWGATLDKDTVIRRSAIGLNETGTVLFASISDATTATAIAKAMNHAGAHSVAQLDVNWSYPKFITVEPKDGDLKNLYAKPIIAGFEYTEDDYIRKVMDRDFFYLTRKSAAELPAAEPPAAPAATP